MTRSTIAATLALTLCAGLAQAQSTITLFGQRYEVQRVDYEAEVRFPDTEFPGDFPSVYISLVEVEGTHYAGNNRLYFSSDALGQVWAGNPKNFAVEVQLVTNGSTVTGLQYVRTLVTQSPTPATFDLDPSGITVNPTSTGMGAGGNLVVASSREVLRAYSLQNATLGMPMSLTVPPATCPTPSTCFLNLAGQVGDCEDIAFVPAFGARAASFYALNQEFPDQVVRLSLPGAPIAGGFTIGGDVAGGSLDFNPTPKGITYVADSAAFPSAITRAGGTLMVALDNDVPGLQVFDFSGNLIASASLTADGTGDGASLLPLGDCVNQLQLESLSVDPATGRLFLTNQGDGFSCNFLYVLTPVASGCNPADICGVGATYDAGAVDVGPDGALTIEDFLNFLSAFGDSTGCPGTSPCNPADICGVGATYDNGAVDIGPDGELTIEDFLNFLSAFGDSAGCS